MARDPRASASSVTDQLQKELVGEALRKRQQGEMPTAPERAALRRWEEAREEEQRWV